MQFNFDQPNIRTLLGNDITAWTSESLSKCSGALRRQNSNTRRKPSPFIKSMYPNPTSSITNAPPPTLITYSELSTIIDTMGQASATAQGLGAVITTTSRLISNSEQVLFIAGNSTSALGIIKFGTKHLFHRMSNGGVHEITPMCVLDFYVHEQCQRQGVGSALFNYALQYFNTTPSQLGYDRPSIKFLSFLKKHHNLQYYDPQNNNFVVYNDYFGNGGNDGNEGNGKGRYERNNPNNYLTNGKGREGGGRPVAVEEIRTTNNVGNARAASEYSSWFDTEQQSSVQSNNRTLLGDFGDGKKASPLKTVQSNSEYVNQQMQELAKQEMQRRQEEGMMGLHPGQSRNMCQTQNPYEQPPARRQQQQKNGNGNVNRNFFASTHRPPVKGQGGTVGRNANNNTSFW